MIRKPQSLFWITDKEKKEIYSLWEQCKEELNIGYHRKSELFSQFIIEGLNNLLQTCEPRTTTKTQKSLLGQRREYITNTLAAIQEEEYINFTDLIGLFFHESDLFLDADIRTKSEWFNKILCSEELSFINTSEGLFAIHKTTKWFKQFRKFSYSLRENFFVERNPKTTLNHYKQKLKTKILKQAPKIERFDRAEKTMLASFLSKVRGIEKPLIDNSDWNMMEVIRLRSEGKYSEAQNTFKQEKQKEQEKQENDEGLNFLNNIRTKYGETTK